MGEARRASLPGSVPASWWEGPAALPVISPARGPLTHTHAQGPIPAGSVALAELVCLAQPRRLHLLAQPLPRGLASR